MLPTTLNTNEVKNAAGTEQEFQRRQTSGQLVEFSLIGESPSAPHRLKIQHQDVGSGITRRRRSVVRFTKTVAGQVDATKSAEISAYAVVDAPVGQLTAYTAVTDLMANLVSFLASRGVSTTILFDGTGCGAEALINGSL
jgi:hypothetical protein